MKITAAFLLTAGLHVSAKAISQTITYSARDVHLEKVFSVIEQQTGYGFFYKLPDLKDAKPVTVNFKNTPLQEALEKILQNQSLQFSIQGITVVISRKPAQAGEFQSPASFPNPPPADVQPADEISGKVANSNGEPLAGVSVTVQGTKAGTATNGDGNYSINASGKDTLIFSFVGYSIRKVPVNGRSEIDVVLEVKVSSLEQVVALGYETTTRKNITASIAHVDAKDIASYTTGNVANALEGEVPGVQIVSGGGAPGAQPRILVNGLSSINYNNTPLIIVDGVEVGFNDLNFLNPADIQSMDVLKDASASAIYGARGGAGVILITTKKGSGKPAINVAATAGMNYLRKPKLAGAPEYTRVMNQIARNSGQIIPFPDSAGIAGTDYWDQAFDAGRTQNYLLSATGGKNGFSFYGSLGYYRSDSYNATNKGGNWQKFTSRFNADVDISKVFKMGLSLAPRYETSLNSPGTIFGAYSMDPTTAPFKTVDSLYRSLPGGFDMTAFNPYYSLPNRSNFNGITNPAFNYATNFNKIDYFGLQGAVYLQATPVKNLDIKSTIQTSFDLTQANNYTPKYYLAANVYNNLANVSSSTGYNTRWKITTTAHYKFNIHSHYIDLLAGESTDKYVVKGTNATLQNIPLDAPPFQNIAGGTTVLAGGGSYQPGDAPWGNMVSYFGSLRYNYKGKYYLAGTMRADGSSLVNPLYRWGYFPTASGAWVMSEEPFFKNLINVITYLKLRASWGKSGGNLPPYPGAYLTTLGATNYPDASGGYVIGYVPGIIANPVIKWEIQQDYTFGVDAILLNDKLNISVEKYVRNPRNLLENVTVDFVLGYPQGYYPAQLANIGKMTTKGWDAAIGYKDNLSSKFHFGVNLTLSHFKSVVDDLGTADPIFGGESNDVITTFRSRVTKGHEPGAWYGYLVDGIFQSNAEAQAYVNKDGAILQPAAQAGDLKYRDANGDGVIDTKDLTDLGSPWPKLTTSLTLTLNYGRFDFKTQLYGSWGAKYFQSYRLNMNPSGHLNFKSGFAGQFWHGQGTSNAFPVLRYPDNNGNFSNMSSFFLDKANFVKCNLIQLGYSLPGHWIKGIENLRIFVSVQDLFVITRYTGLNPDLPWYSTVGYNGVDNYQNPLSRTFLVGLNLNL
jgi:TonB-linked SusC/RagA family outer membrane protein